MEQLVAKSYMTNGLLIYGEIFAHIHCISNPFLIYDFATAPLLNFLIYEEKNIFIFISEGGLFKKFLRASWI
jgi:hypothetical protein